MESAKRSRRSAKGKLTRASKTVTKLLEWNRPASEVYEALTTLKAEYNELSEKHVTYCQLLTEDDLYEEEEKWMEVCWEERVKLEVAVNEYLISKAKKDTPLPRDQEITDTVKHAYTDTSTESSNTASHNTTMPGNDDINQGTDGDSATHDKPANQGVTDKMSKENKSNYGFKLRKEFIPTFSGDIREYAIFKSDFHHIVDSKCTERDAITLLRSSLKGKPAELIRGITHDYTAAWDYLDSVYGDPRYVADAITEDLATFRYLEEGEDARFCDLVHLVRRSYNTLNELGRASDMDNNHILALIEQNMCINDRRNWSRDIEKEKKPATLKTLLVWMTTEMRARMRSSAPLRNTVQTFNDTGIRSVNHTASILVGRNLNVNSNPKAHRPSSPNRSTLPDKCWLCHISDHWTDQCPSMNAMSPAERLLKIKENHACFSCLKRAGRNHTSDTCYRRRQCLVWSNGEQCRMYHHSLLHGAGRPNGESGPNAAGRPIAAGNLATARSLNAAGSPYIAHIPNAALIPNAAHSPNASDNPNESTRPNGTHNLNSNTSATVAREVNHSRALHLTVSKPIDIPVVDGREDTGTGSEYKSTSNQHDNDIVSRNKMEPTEDAHIDTRALKTPETMEKQIKYAENCAAVFAEYKTEFKESRIFTDLNRSMSTHNVIPQERNSPLNKTKTNKKQNTDTCVKQVVALDNSPASDISQRFPQKMPNKVKDANLQWYRNTTQKIYSSKLTRKIRLTHKENREQTRELNQVNTNICRTRANRVNRKKNLKKHTHGTRKDTNLRETVGAPDLKLCRSQQIRENIHLMRSASKNKPRLYSTAYGCDNAQGYTWK